MPLHSPGQARFRPFILLAFSRAPDVSSGQCSFIEDARTAKLMLLRKKNALCDSETDIAPRRATASASKWSNVAPPQTSGPDRKVTRQEAGPTLRAGPAVGASTARAHPLWAIHGGYGRSCERACIHRQNPCSSRSEGRGRLRRATVRVARRVSLVERRGRAAHGGHTMMIDRIAFY